MRRFIYPIMICVFWGIVLSYVFKSSVPVVSNMSHHEKASLFNFFPQGWGFFTRNPREEELILYRIEKDTTVRFTQTNSSSSSYFGLSRKNRLINIEASIVVSEVDDSLWIPMKGRELVLDLNTYTDTIVNNFKPCHIQGDFFLVMQERIPWAWSESDIIMPYKYVKVHIITN